MCNSLVIIELAFFIPGKTLISVQNSNFTYLQLFLRSGRVQSGPREKKEQSTV